MKLLQQSLLTDTLCGSTYVYKCSVQRAKTQLKVGIL